MPRRAQQPIFRPLEQLRAHELVAEQIRRQIALRLVPPGQSLPPERELARLFGVGRATVQQAIQLLEREQLLESRRGRSGGTFVVASAQGDETPVAVLGRVRKDREAILEALVFRIELEPAAAAAAAVARSQTDLVAMKAAYRAAAATEDDAEFMEHDTELHLALGRATGNRYFAESLERLRLVLNDALVALPDSVLWHARSNREHELLLEALEAGDGRAARRAMHTHVAHTDQSVRALLAAL
jgi:GntR family transcriptional regulator, transcriptional repressor for pyruvate dehydrogenase complex